MEKIIIPCSNATDLAMKLATELRCGVAQVETRAFPDEEHYFRIDTDLAGKEAIIVQSGYPQPNNALFELILAIDAAKSMRAKKIFLVVTYFPYGRQDKTFKPGEAFSLKVLVTFLKHLGGVRGIITADAHFRKTFKGSSLFGLRWKNATAGALLVNYLKAKFSIRQAHLISPDFGAGIEVEEAAKATGSNITVLTKKRGSDWDVNIKGQLNVAGKDVIVLDDIISTGGTMAEAIKKCKEAGAKRVFAAATHGLFVGNALQRVRNAGVDYVVTTDSIKNETSEVSLAHEIASVL